MSYHQTIKNIKHTITGAYYNLLKAIKDHQIDQNNYDKSKMNYDLGVKKFKTGLIPEVDALQLEVSFNQKQVSLLRAENQINRTKESLLFYMGLSLDHSLDINKDILFKTYNIDFNRTLERSIEKDLGINSTKLAIYEQEENYKAIEDDNDLNAFAKLDYSHYIRKWSPNFPSQYEYNVGVSLNLVYPLIDFGLSRKKLQRLKRQIEISRIKIQKQKIQLERNLNELVRSIEENRKKISIYSNAVYVSRKRYDINVAQFEDGIITTLDLLISENDLNDSERSYLGTIINYKTTLSEINRDYIVIYE